MLDTKEPRSVHTRLKPIESVKKRLDPNTKRQYDNAITAAERAVSLNPNGADAFGQLAYTLDFSDKSAQAVDFFKKAMRLNPIPPSYYFQQLGHTFWHLNRYDEAIEAHKEAIRLSPDCFFAYLGLAAAYSLTDCEEEAEVAAAEVLRIDPEFSLEDFERACPDKRRARVSRYIAALSRAGLK